MNIMEIDDESPPLASKIIACVCCCCRCCSVVGVDALFASGGVDASLLPENKTGASSGNPNVAAVMSASLPCVLRSSTLGPVDGLPGF